MLLTLCLRRLGPPLLQAGGSAGASCEDAAANVPSLSQFVSTQFQGQEVSTPIPIVPPLFFFKCLRHSKQIQFFFLKLAPSYQRLPSAHLEKSNTYQLLGQRIAQYLEPGSS